MVNKNSKRLYSFQKQSETNKATKYFTPLKVADNGRYFCASFKYNLFKVIYVANVDVDAILLKRGRKVDNMIPHYFCSETMFSCVLNGTCIHQHYVCDGKCFLPCS